MSIEIVIRSTHIQTLTYDIDIHIKVVHVQIDGYRLDCRTDTTKYIPKSLLLTQFFLDFFQHKNAKLCLQFYLRKTRENERRLKNSCAMFIFQFKCDSFPRDFFSLSTFVHLNQRK